MPFLYIFTLTKNSAKVEAGETTTTIISKMLVLQKELILYKIESLNNEEKVRFDTVHSYPL